MKYKLKYPLATEKGSRLITSENKLTFIVDRKMSKAEVKKAVEEQFKVKVLSVQSMVLDASNKKVYVKLSMDNPALDVATKLGLL